MSRDLRETVEREIAMFREGYTDTNPIISGDDRILANHILTIARPQIERETREACAKVADDWAGDVKPPPGDTTLGAIGGIVSAGVAEAIAAAIRSQP